MERDRRPTRPTAARRLQERVVPLVAATMVLSGALLLATSSTARAAAAGADTVRLHPLSLPHATGGARSGVSAATGTQGTAQTPATRGSSPPCTNQHGLNDPTSSGNQALDSYQYSIQHAGTTTKVCSLFGNVHAGDVVTASFVVHDHASVEVTLVVDTFVAGSTRSQVLAQCASFSSVPDSGSDACSTSASPSLTVTVPQCGFQIDLVYGEPIPALTTGAYADARVWIDGSAGEKTTACAPGAPTPTPVPTGPPGSPTGSGSGSGVRAVSTPETGWAPGSAQGIIGIALVVSGSAVLVAGRRRSAGADVMRRRRASNYPRIFRR